MILVERNRIGKEEKQTQQTCKLFYVFILERQCLVGMGADIWFKAALHKEIKRASPLAFLLLAVVFLALPGAGEV